MRICLWIHFLLHSRFWGLVDILSQLPVRDTPPQCIIIKTIIQHIRVIIVILYIMTYSSLNSGHILLYRPQNYYMHRLAAQLSEQTSSDVNVQCAPFTSYYYYYYIGTYNKYDRRNNAFSLSDLRNTLVFHVYVCECVYVCVCVFVEHR